MITVTPLHSTVASQKQSSLNVLYLINHKIRKVLENPHSQWDWKAVREGCQISSSLEYDNTPPIPTHWKYHWVYRMWPVSFGVPLLLWIFPAAKHFLINSHIFLHIKAFPLSGLETDVQRTILANKAILAFSILLWLIVWYSSPKWGAAEP